MPKIPLPILISRSIDDSALPGAIGARLVNAYIDKDSGTPVIRKSPGLELLLDVGVNFPVDGLYWWDKMNRAVFVVNGQIYEMTTVSGAYTDITGDALTAVKKTSITDNGYSLFLASGDRIVTKCLENAPTGATGLAIGSTKTKVAHGSFSYYIYATKYSVSADTVGVNDCTDVVPLGKYGAIALDMDAAGAVTITPADDNATGYSSAALAIAGIPRWSSAYCRIGTVTVIKSDGAFTFGTTNFDAANVTTAYTAATVIAEAGDGPVTAYLSDTDAPTDVSMVDYLDGYILALKENSQYFYWSEIGVSGKDPANWSATNFANPSSKPTNLRALKVENREIVLWGNMDADVWYNDGSTPFSRLDGAYFPRGIIAPDSLVFGGGSFYWLDHERRICTKTGNQIAIISGPYDDHIRRLEPVSDAIGMFFSLGKNAFYVITWPTAKFTVVYNAVNQTMSEWGDWDSAKALYTAWKGRTYCYCRAWDMHLVGDNSTGKIYKLRADIFDIEGEPVRTVCRTGWNDDGEFVQKREVELRVRCKRGLGDISDNEPVFSLRYRDNGNQTWKDERQVSLGKMGDYEMIKRIMRTGVYRTRQYEIIHSEETDFILSDLEHDIEVVG